MNNFQAAYPLIPLREVAPLALERVQEFDGLRKYIATADATVGEIIGGLDINFAERPTRADIEVKPKDVLFARMQATVKVLFADEQSSQYIFSTGFAVCRPSKRILPKFLYYWFTSPEFNSAKDSLCTGATQKAISNSGIENLKIPLTPLAEQERIVRLLDEAVSLQQLRRQADARMKQFVSAMFDKMFGNPEINEKKWKIRPLSDLLSTIDSGWSPVCLDRPVKRDEWGMLKLGALTSCEYDDTQNKAFQKVLEPRPELEVKAGDVLFSRKNTHDLVAACVFVFHTRSKLMLSDLTFRLCIRDRNVLLPEYLWQTMIHPNKRKKIQTLATGSAAQMPNISKARLMTIEIPVPPLELQREFATRVHEARAMQDAQVKSGERIEALYQSILYRSFAGDL